ncbi:MAG: VWA domain-containing protein [Hyphomicrobiaceae bacterium]
MIVALRFFCGIASFAAQRSGAVAPLTAMVVLVLIGAAGAAVDLGRAVTVRSELQARADAAVIAMARVAADDRERARQVGERTFWATKERKDIDADITVDFSVSSAGAARVTVDGTISTGLLGAVGIGTIPIAVAAEAAVGGGQYIDLNFVVDVSGSMNIPDSEADIALLSNVFRPFGGHSTCAFACHNGGAGDALDHATGQTGFEIARSLGIYLREDRIRDAIRRLVDRIDSSPERNRVRFGLYDFTGDFVVHTPPTNAVSVFKTRLAELRTELSGGTHLGGVMPNIATAIGESGTGSASNPKSIVILITDGVDYQGWGSVPTGLAMNACEPLKARGHDVYVLNIKYPDPDRLTDFASNPNVVIMRTLVGDLEGQLRSCASPGHYYEADYGISIDMALGEMTGAAIGTGTLRLTH